MASKPFPAPDITILNSMAGREFEAALDRHLAWGITRLDLKDFIFGKPVVELSDREVEAASRMIAERKLSVYALSTSLFAQDVEAGETAFRQGHFGRIARVLEIAAAFAPTFIRLIAASTERRRSVADGIRYAAAEAPWLFELYDEAIDRIAGAGYTAVIENETEGCLLSCPREVLDFFAALQNANRARFTWDVVNMWQAGTFPSVEAYEALRPVIGYVHLKGGQCDRPLGPLKWRSPLDEASWPVRDIVARVVSDGVSPVICLNPPHGELRPGVSPAGWAERDITFVRQLLHETVAAGPNP